MCKQKNSIKLSETEKNYSDQSVLIVEDELINRTLLKHTVTEIGCRVIEAENGTVALDLMNGVLPDLVLLDIIMPEMDGFELCKIMKADKNLRDIPIIFISARAEEEAELKGLELGAVDYIFKPINQAIVKARVTTHLDLKRHRDRLEEMVESRTLELQKAFDKIRVLKGLLPICASCNKIRDDKGYWNRIDVYIEHHSEAEFTHGICPECAKKLNPELYEDI